MVFDDDELDVQRVVKPGAHQGRVEVEQAVGDGGSEGQSDQAMREREFDAGHEEQGRPDRQNGGDKREGHIEGGAQSRVASARALRIEARGAKPEPIEKGGLHRRGRGKRQGKSAVFLRPQELGDEKSNGEVEEDVQEKGDKNLHAAADPGATRRAVQEARQRIDSVSTDIALPKPCSIAPSTPIDQVLAGSSKVIRPVAPLCQT